jgi:hypothetical protein
MLTLKVQCGNNMHIFRYALPLAFLFHIRQFPFIKGGFVTFLTCSRSFLLKTGFRFVRLVVHIVTTLI